MRADAADTAVLNDRGQEQSLLYDAFISCGHRAAAHGVQRGLHHKQQDALAGRADRRAGGRSCWVPWWWGGRASLR